MRQNDIHYPPPFYLPLCNLQISLTVFNYDYGNHAKSIKEKSVADYFKLRKAEVLEKLNNLKEELPEFTDEFFVGIASLTSELTRLNYAYDLRVFFYYLTVGTRRFKNRIPTEFCKADLETITTYDLENYLEWLSSYDFNGKHYTNEANGKARKLSTVRAMFKYFFNKGDIVANTAAKVTMPKLHDKEIIRLEGKEVENILNATQTGDGLTKKSLDFHEKTKVRDKAIVTLLLGTGIRVSECVGLNINDIDFNNRAFTVTRKGGSRTILYFGKEVEDALGEYIYDERLNVKDALDPDALFLSLQKKRICVRTVEILVKKYAHLIAPLKKISPHKLRSTFGTNLYRETRDIYMVADVLGHRDVNTTKKHYAAISDDHRRQAAEVIKLKNDDEN